MALLTIKDVPTPVPVGAAPDAPDDPVPVGPVPVGAAPEPGKVGYGAAVFAVEEVRGAVPELEGVVPVAAALEEDVSGAEPGRLEPVSVAVTGQMVVYSSMVVVMYASVAFSAGQLLTVGAQV